MLLPARRDPAIESEEGQARFRFYLAAFVLICASLASGKLGAQRQAVFTSISAYLLFAYIWVWLSTKQWGPLLPRQWSALLLDHGVLSVGLSVSGVVLAPLLWVPVTISIGHGLRFGERRGLAAALLGGICTYAALGNAALWPVDDMMRVGAAMTALIGPVYVVRLVRTMASQKARSEQRTLELEEVVRQDGLTGASNRLGFEQAVHHICDEQRRFAVRAGIVLIDLDGFKAVNDNLGHGAGDRVLQEVALLLRQAVRSADLVARFGGDEFAVLLREPGDEKNVRRIVTDLVQSISGIRLPGDSGLVVGASAGACLLDVGVSAGEAMKRADELMYEAKRGGKNDFRVEHLHP